jgi:hypothetical protein
MPAYREGDGTQVVGHREGVHRLLVGEQLDVCNKQSKKCSFEHQGPASKKKEDKTSVLSTFWLLVTFSSLRVSICTKGHKPESEGQSQISKQLG